MYKNTDGQVVIFEAFTASTLAPKTGDAANITCYLSKDGGELVASTNACTELLAGATPLGSYVLALTQEETNCDVLHLLPTTVTSGVQCVKKTFYTNYEMEVACDAAITANTTVLAIKDKTDTIPALLDAAVFTTPTTEDTNYTNSFLYRAIDTIRTNLDEPAVNAKYSDARLTNMIGESYVNVLSEVNRLSRRPIVSRFNITITETIEDYVLPYHATAIVAIYQDGGSGVRIFYDNGGHYSVYGQQLWLEHNTLKVRSGFIPTGTVLTVEYKAGGCASLCTGEISSATDASDGLSTLVVADGTPYYGTLDLHQNGYIGSVLRVWTASEIQERIITGYDCTTYTLTVKPALTALVGDAYYEIAPAIYQGLDHVVGLYTAMWISSIEGHPVRSARLEKLYARTIRNVRLNEFYSRLDTAGNIPMNSHDYERYRVLGR